MEGDDNNTNAVYRECLRNHAASLGSYATDGCGEFTLDHTHDLHCAACGCHRNFHRKLTYAAATAPTGASCQETASDMMIGYGGGGGGGVAEMERSYGGKKRFRTKFTVEQKEEMMGFAEKLGWKLQKRRDEEDEIERFCRGVGVSRQVFKVWMHNHKNSASSSTTASTGNASSLTQ